MLPFQVRQQFLPVKSLGVVEVNAHRLREGLVAIGNHVEQVADRDDLSQLEVIAPIHQQLQHQLQGRALALQGRRHRNQRLHQRRAERIDLAEHLLVGGLGQQGVPDLGPDFLEFIEGVSQRLPGRFGSRPEHPFLGDRRQVAVFKRNAMKARLPVAQHVAELQLQRAGQVLADQFAQVALPRDEADQRNRAIGVAGFHQLDQLGALAADKAHVGRPTGQPQDQLVEEQDHRVVAERLGVAAHDAEAIVERHEGLTAALGHVGNGSEVAADQVANQAHTVVAAWRLEHRGFEARGIPAAAQFAPAAVITVAGV